MNIYHVKLFCEVEWDYKSFNIIANGTCSINEYIAYNYEYANRMEIELVEENIEFPYVFEVK